jgi:hypothetical protein
MPRIIEMLFFAIIGSTMDFLSANSQLCVMTGELVEAVTADMLCPGFIELEAYLRYIETFVVLHVAKHSIFQFTEGRGLYECLREYSREQLDEMCELSKYLLLPSELTEKLENAKAAFGINRTCKLPKMLKLKWDVIKFKYDNADHWVRIGDLEGLKDAHARGGRIHSFAVRYAIQGGHLDCLKYIHEHDPVNMNVRNCSFAAESGQLDCLKYLHEIGCPWDTETCQYAASYGYLDCLQYAHEQGCPWNEWVCVYATQTGHLNCLQYAHEHGCPWNARTCSSAAENGHFDCLQYARDHGCPE